MAEELNRLLDNWKMGNCEMESKMPIGKKVVSKERLLSRSEIWEIGLNQ